MYTSYIFIAALLVGISHQSNAQTTPAPYGALPSERQLKILEMEMYCILHFTPSTFQNKEWGFGDADPAIFNPGKFDAGQIVAAIKAGGFKGITVVAKHHDGFCLWPTKTTPYNISKSPFRNGKGDLVKEFLDATVNANLRLGVYCSPWDRNNADYATPKYVTDVYYRQLEELYGHYGSLYTVFFDGANGGDGYYGGASETRKINAPVYYNFDTIWEMVRSMQPMANIFSDVGPDLRWVGNEQGRAAETSWATLTPVTAGSGKKPAPGFVDDKVLPGGTRNGQFWIPAECDVPMRPGWFFHPEQEDNVKSPAELLEIYYASVGRGGTFDLGISPNTDGLLSDGDVKKLAKFGSLLRQTFAVNLAKGAKLTSSNTRGKSVKFSSALLLDNDRYSYWATDDNITTPEVVFEMKTPVKFNVIRIRENIKLGQRIEAVAVDAWLQNEWIEIGSATSIGANRLIRLPEYVLTKKVRLRITKSPVSVALSDFGLFAEPEELMRTVPATAKTRMSKSDWKADGAGPAIDNNAATIWTSAGEMPQHLDIDMGGARTIKAFVYLPRQDKQKAGIVDQYAFYTSSNGIDWALAAEGEFSNIVNNPVEQVVPIDNPVHVRYFRFEARRVAQGVKATAAEIGLR
jgi:alpha-L-fucosidase